MIRASTLRALVAVVRTPQFIQLVSHHRSIEEAETTNAAWIGVLAKLLAALDECQRKVDNLPAKDASA